MPARLARAARRLRPYLPELAIALAAIAIASVFAATVLRHARPSGLSLGLPLDEAYAYLAGARQLGRGEPPPAGAASALWPLLLAPCWALGARGPALIGVSLGLCAALYAATCVGCYRLARELAGALAGLAAAALVLGAAPLAGHALAGAEVALASALLVAALLLHARAPRVPDDAPPPRALAVCLAAAGLASPEAAILVALAGGAAIAGRLRRRRWRAAAWWAAPLVAPAAWRILRGGGPAAPPGAASGLGAAVASAGGALEALLGGEAGPLPWPRLTAALWLVGALRVLGWARRERRWAAGALVVAAPLVLIGAALASPEAAGPRGARALAVAAPLVLIVAACALAPPRRAALARWAPARIGRALGACALAALSGWAAAPALRQEPVRYARAAIDLERQAGQLGRYVRRELPGASILAREAGALAYHGDAPVSDRLGAGAAAAHGPGAIFERLEALPPGRRPTHLVAGAADPPGASAFLGAAVRETSPAGGGAGLRLHAASWDHAHTAERPLDEIPGWRVVDRVDVADLASERGHRYRAALGRAAPGDPPARWSLVHREVRATGLVLDGGRAIRGGAERFTIEIDPARPVRLLLRTGGGRADPSHEAPAAPVTVVVSTRAGTVQATIPPPRGALVELALELPVPPAREVVVRVTATGPYRAFHWFALQPEVSAR